MRARPTPAGFAEAGVEVHLDTPGGDLVTRARTLVKSPGVPADAPVVTAARERGITVIGELELAWRLIPNEFVAVTGTNGKTTTTELLGHIHREAGLPVAVAGNVGTAVASLVGVARPRRDRRLRGVLVPARGHRGVRPRGRRAARTSPRTTSTATAPSRRYVAAKLQAFARQGNDDVAVYPCDVGIEDLGGCARRLCFGTEPEAELADRAGQLWWADEPLLPVDEIRLRGPHNRRNAMAAAAVAPRPRGRPGRRARRPADLRRASRTASRRWPSATACSTSTTPRRPTSPPRSSPSLVRGRRAPDRSAAGARARASTPLRAPVAERCRGGVPDRRGGGASSPRRWRAPAPPVHRCGDLERAAAAARAAARPGEVVLLSPACASYDQYPDFEARGEHFRALAMEGA